MNVFTQKVFALAVAASLLAQAGLPAGEPEKNAPPKPTLRNDKDKAGFLFGYQLGNAFARFGPHLDMAVIEQAAREALAGKDSKLSDEQNKQVMKQFFEFIAKKASPNGAGVTLSPEDKANASYMFGRNLASSIEFIADDFNLELFFATYSVCANGNKINMDVAELEPAVKTYLDGNKKKALERMCARNKRVGAAFLEDNKKKDGVKVTASGLQYRVIKEGTGPKPVMPAKIAAHFRGSYVNGQIFDDTHQRGQPRQFPLDSAIDGLIEAFKLMPEGSTYEVVVPSDLAFGDNGSPSIQPGSTLVYQLELVKANVVEETPKK